MVKRLDLLETTLIFYPKLGTYLKQVSKSLSLHGCCPHSKYVEKTNQFCSVTILLDCMNIL